jgi:hypothetical protein
MTINITKIIVTCDYCGKIVEENKIYFIINIRDDRKFPMAYKEVMCENCFERFEKLRQEIKTEVEKNGQQN